ncbi:MFS transporter [Bradyrhizobium sp. dw_78]|uniref:MFS transporter n=1 Tax=Bradyrhizobium sp. dw_78 TaxID=2719793 RepID=UPI001BD611A8|nr:MFS transporter [Bradyrhizobium sp. dw_78]
MQTAIDPPKSLIERYRAALVLICVSAPSFMLQLDANIVAVSLPSISDSLKANFAGIEWVVTAYTLAFASLLLPAGAFADRFGRKRVLMTGLVLFTAASFFCGAAPNLATLVTARAFQGAGAALQLSAALATLSSFFKGDERARAFAFWGSVVGIGISLGPIVGGLITQGFGWEWAFYINLPVGALTIALVAVVITDSRDPGAVRFDLAGVSTFSAFLFLTTLALISGNHDGWTSPHILAEGIGAILFLALFAVVELREARPMVDFSFFRRPTYLGANIAQFSFAAGLLSMLTFMPIYFQHALGFSPRAAGLAMLPMALPLFIVPRIVTSYLSHRLTGRTLLTAGLALVSIGLGLVALVAGHQDYRWMLAAMLVTGLGAGLLNGETTKVGMTVIPAERAGMASGISGTMRFTGIVIGFAALGVVLFSRISVLISAALPAIDDNARAGFIRDVASGNLSGDGIPSISAATLHALALQSFTAGYTMLFAASAAFCLVATILTWWLVQASDTQPIAKKQRRTERPVQAPLAVPAEGEPSDRALMPRERRRV